MITIKKINQKYYKKINLLDLELIISRVIKKPREFVLAHPEKKLSRSQISNFKFQISKRLKGEPLAYTFGHKEFYGLDFKVNKNTLIPRPETELIIDEALRHVTGNLKPSSGTDKHVTFIDVGTGSGCIIITLARVIKSKLPITNYQLLATDISKPALQIARQNAKLHDVNEKIKFLYGNLLEPILKNSKFLIPNSKFLITANLPYLTPFQIKKYPTIQHEPKPALNAGQDGLKYYRQLFKQINSLCKSLPSLYISVLCEINPEQATKMKKIIKKNVPSAKIKMKKDLRGYNRLVFVQA